MSTPIQYTAYSPTPPIDTSAIQPQATHYPNHYPNVPITVPLTVPIPGQPTASYYSPYPTTGLPGANILGIQDGIPQHHQIQTNPAPARPPSPPEPAITPLVAQQALRRLIENELIDVGFESADVQSVRRLEVETVACASCAILPPFLNLLTRDKWVDVQQLFERAHEYANLANRAGTIAPDLLLCLDDFGIEPKELYPLAQKRRTQSTETSINAAATNTSTPNADPASLMNTVPSPKKRLKRSTWRHLPLPLFHYSSSPFGCNRIETLTNQTHVLQLPLTIPRPPTLRR